MSDRVIVFAYLAAIVAANLSVAVWGPSVAVFNAFLLIGLDLSARDRLHDAWQGRGLLWKMGLLIATGGLLSYLLNRDAGQIAVASTVAFAAAASVDALVYHLLRDRPFLVKANASNVPGAGVDSFVFPALAFGFPLLWGVMAGQFVAKVAGGAVWAWVIDKWRKRREAAWRREQMRKALRDLMGEDADLLGE